MRTEEQPSGADMKGRIFGTLFGLFFLLIGVAFTVFVLQLAIQSAKTYFWQEVPCTIVSSTVAIDLKSDSPYSPAIGYRYEFDDKNYQSSQYNLAGAKSRSYSEAFYLTQAYPKGSSKRAYVNPKNPQQAILRKGGLWLFIFAFFPLVFVLIGGVVVYAACFGVDEKPEGVSAISDSAAPSGAANKPWGSLVGALFFSLFFIVGCIAFYYTVYFPFSLHFDSAQWLEREAQVVHSRVMRHDGDDSVSYSPDILYAYTVEGREYRSNRYSFFRQLSNSYRTTKNIIEGYPRGTKIRILVDPKNFAEAVLHRRLNTHSYFGFLTLLFVFVGAGGMIAMLRSYRKAKQVVASSRVSPSDYRWNSRQQTQGELQLHTNASPLMRFFGAGLFAVVWNGLISIPILQGVEAWQRGSADWFLLLVMLPFALIGIVLIVSTIYCLLALINPRPKVFLSKPRIQLGDTLSVRWEIVGRISRISELRLSLLGEEEAKYRRGTTTHTDKETFYEVVLAEKLSAREIKQGNTPVEIPANTMHSFSAANNTIRWKLRIHGVINRWPDVSEEYQIEVEPA